MECVKDFCIWDKQRFTHLLKGYLHQNINFFSIRQFTSVGIPRMLVSKPGASSISTFLTIDFKELFLAENSYYPETTSMCPPLDQVKCKGAQKGWSKTQRYSKE
jgi:hypothetical protein